jgi:hypothetical protein
LSPTFKNEIEYIEIDTHEGVDSPLNKRGRQAPVQLIQIGETQEWLAKTVHR